jgi:hypothetical protein
MGHAGSREQVQRTCDSCTKTETVPGVGLTPLIQEEYEAKLEALQELVSGTRNTTFENLHAAGSTSLPITRGVIEALRDEPDQDLLARRLASEVALSSVLEKALLLQRTLLTGKKEPNVAANQLAVEAVNHESDTLDQEIRNLKTELELRRELANNSPMAIIQRHGTRAAGSRGIYEGDPGARPPRPAPEGQSGRQPMNARQLAAPALAFQPARGEGIAVDGGARRRCRGRQHRRHLPRRQRCQLGAVADGHGGLLPGVAAVPVRRNGLRLGLDASPAAGARGPTRGG